MNQYIKWVVAALVISVGVNIFMVGLSLGKNITSGKMLRLPSHEAGINARALGQYLSQDERAAMRALLDGERLEMRRRLQALRRNEEDIRQAFRAEVVDMNRLRDLIDTHEQLVTGTRSGVQEKLFEFMATLAPETRRALADDLFMPRERRRRSGEEGLESRPPRGNHDGFGPPPRSRPPSGHDPVDF